MKPSAYRCYTMACSKSNLPINHYIQTWRTWNLSCKESMPTGHLWRPLPSGARAWRRNLRVGGCARKLSISLEPCWKSDENRALLLEQATRIVEAEVDTTLLNSFFA